MKITKIQNNRTICRKCLREVDDTGKKDGEWVIHCNIHNLVGNKQNIYKEREFKDKIKVGDNKVIKNDKVKKIRKMDLIGEMLAQNKSVTEIMNIVGVSPGYIVAVKKYLGKKEND